jgi:hypothetical protein
MPQMSFDLMDGKPKVSFPLKQDDVDRFVQFMNDCNGYMKERDTAKEQAERLKRVLQESYDQRDELLLELKAARRAIRAIKREQGKFDHGRTLCIEADKRTTAVIIKAEAN